LYEAHYEAAGFYRVETPQRGDMIVMAIGRTVYPNHAGIYLGEDASLPGETSGVVGAGPFLLHHLCGRRSEVMVLGGSWNHKASMNLRHCFHGNENTQNLDSMMAK
jgi:cell wall-associated NlpC family hydrolase